MKLCWMGLMGGVKRRWKVVKRIWPNMLGIALTYSVTLSLFPGLESEVESCSLGDWMPVLLMAVFNSSDILGKLLATIPHSWSQGELVLWPLARLLLVPLLLLTAAPRHQPVFQGEFLPLLLTAVLGISNGIFGSLSMSTAPILVEENEREVAGVVMTFSYCFGLTLGVLASYWLDSIVGPPSPPSSSPCLAGIQNGAMEGWNGHRFNAQLGIHWSEAWYSNYTM